MVGELMTYKEQIEFWEKERNSALQGWEKANPRPVDPLPDTIAGYSVVKRQDNSGYDVGCQFVPYETLKEAVRRLEESAPRWKVVYEPKKFPHNIVNTDKNGFGNGTVFNHPETGFTSLKDAEAFQKRMKTSFPDYEFTIMPFEATSLGYWALFKKFCDEEFNADGWLKGDQKNRFNSYEKCKKYFDDHRHFFNMDDDRYQIRFVEE